MHASKINILPLRYWRGCEMGHFHEATSAPAEGPLHRLGLTRRCKCPLRSLQAQKLRSCGNRTCGSVWVWHCSVHPHLSASVFAHVEIAHLAVSVFAHFWELHCWRHLVSAVMFIFAVLGLSLPLAVKPQGTSLSLIACCKETDTSFPLPLTGPNVWREQL